MDTVSLTELTACVDQRWSPVMGDPTVMGWTIFLYYLAGSLACFIVGWLRPRDVGIWVIFALLLLVLGVNKQLDLQSALTATGRCLAQIQGWYDQRRAVQLAFFMTLFLICALGMAFTLYRLRRRLRRFGLALLGLSVLIAFAALRAASFLHVDAFMNAKMSFDMRIVGLMELTGITIVLLNAISAIKCPREHQSSPRVTDLPDSQDDPSSSRRSGDA